MTLFVVVTLRVPEIFHQLQHMEQIDQHNNFRRNYFLVLSKILFRSFFLLDSVFDIKHVYM